MNAEYLIAAVPVLALSLVLAWLSFTARMRDAWRKSILWTAIVFVLDLALSIINAVDTGEFSLSAFDRIFVNTLCTPGYYAVLAALFAGPLLYARIRHLKRE